jgi:hypothetical protein
MTKYILSFFMMVALATPVLVHAQRKTEVFIPIGQSPGLSGKYTVIGKIASVNARSRTLTLMDSSASHTVRLTDQTEIFLDRTMLQSPNSNGTVADLRQDRTAEVKFKDNDRQAGIAEWIKVQIPKEQ